MADISRATRKKRRKIRSKIDLSGPGQHRRDDPSTAKSAAIVLKAKTLRWEIVKLHVKAGRHGLTGDELHEAVGPERYDRDTLVPRRPELEREGLLEKHPDELKRPSRKGRNQEVWIATDLARRAIDN